MRISNDESLRASQAASIGRVQGATAQPQVPADQQRQGATPAAVIDLSTHAQAIAAAAVAVDASPDVREDLVAKLKAQVDTGTYKVSNADIADQMIRRAQADRIR